MLEYKDIIGYLNYGLNFYFWTETHDGVVHSPFIYECDEVYHQLHSDVKETYGIPILRPLSDMFKTIKHNGKEEIPIIECAKIAYQNEICNLRIESNLCLFSILNNKNVYQFSFVNGDFITNNFLDKMFQVGFVPNQYKLFDYLDSRFIDYRGLIDNDLAFSCYDEELTRRLGLYINPYEL